MARILIIEDDEMVRYSLRITLENAGHDVFEASDGSEGVDACRAMLASKESIDLVITDILMPEKDGYDTIKDIKALRPDMKIVAISGGGGIDPNLFLKMSEIIGADKIIAKPFSAKDLLKNVNYCLT
jgi:DNA-binding response OmpR family regulator